MFHTILTLSYIIPNIYLFARIWQLFIRKGQRIYYVLIYLLLFLVYPVSNFFHEGGTVLAARVLSGIADYLLPFFLYLFLFVSSGIRLWGPAVRTTGKSEIMVIDIAFARHN